MDLKSFDFGYFELLIRFDVDSRRLSRDVQSKILFLYKFASVANIGKVLDISDISGNFWWDWSFQLKMTEFLWGEICRIFQSLLILFRLNSLTTVPHVKAKYWHKFHSITAINEETVEYWEALTSPIFNVNFEIFQFFMSCFWRAARVTLIDIISFLQYFYLVSVSTSQKKGNRDEKEGSMLCRRQTRDAKICVRKRRVIIQKFFLPSLKNFSTSF